jgi:SAM-dependent methyltransferase
VATLKSSADPRINRPPGAEILDAPDVDPALAERSLRDVMRANALMGGTRAVMRELEAIVPLLPKRATLLDVGTGLGDIPLRARAVVAGHGITLDTVGLEASEWLARASRSATASAVVGDGRALPFASHSVDVVICSQVLHHFFDQEALALLKELDRVARVGVIVSDLNRSDLAVGLLWFFSFVLRFHPVSRHDGMMSIRRGFAPGELRTIVRAATGADPRIEQYLGFRVTAAWAPTGTNGR